MSSLFKIILFFLNVYGEDEWKIGHMNAGKTMAIANNKTNIC